MHRVVVLVLTLALLGLAPLAGAGPTVAQDATPGADAPQLGSPVPIVGPEGSETARLTVADLVDPFQAYDPSSPPPPGHHFVLLTLVAENTGAQPFPLDPSSVLIQDADGYLSAPTSVVRPDPAEPDLEAQDLAPGTEASGAIGFAVLNDVALTRVLYRPDSDRLVVLADLGAPTVALGDPAPVIGPDGREVARVTATALIDPFENYDPNTPPERGTHFVLVTVAIENTGPRPFLVDPNAVRIQDANGLLAAPTFVLRPEESGPPDLQFGELAPGADIEGALAFAVLNDAEIARIIYTPDRERLVVLADSPTGTADEPIVAPTEEPTTPAFDLPTVTIGDETPSADETPTATEEPTAESTEEATEEATEEPFDEPTEEATEEPTEEPEETATAETGTTGVSGNTYVSPDYGYTLTWDESVWFDNDEANQPGYNGLRLDGETSTFFLEGFDGFDGDPQACLDDALAELEADDVVSDLTPAFGLASPSTDPDGASEVITFTVSLAEGDLDLASFIECRTLVPGQAVMEITLRTAAADYEDNLPALEDLLATLALEGETPTVATPAADGTPESGTGFDIDCAGVEAWAEETTARLELASEMSVEDAATDDLALLERHAGEYAALAAEQEAMDVPSGAADLNDQAVAVLTAYADALSQILDAGDDPIALTGGVNAFNDAGNDLSDVLAEVDQLATDCAA